MRRNGVERTGWVDGCGREVGGRWDGSVLRAIPGGESWRVTQGNITAKSGMSKHEIKIFYGGLRGDFTRSGFSVDETTPSFVSLMDDLHSILLVLSFAGEGELVLGLAIWDLVDPRRARG